MKSTCICLEKKGKVIAGFCGGYVKYLGPTFVVFGTMGSYDDEIYDAHKYVMLYHIIFCEYYINLVGKKSHCSLY